METRNYILIVVLLFSFASAASALASQEDSFGGVAISRLYPESAYVGQQIWITIAIENTGAEDSTIEITERLGDAVFDKSEVQDIDTTMGSMYFYEWEAYLPAGENTSVSYWIEPKSPGNYVISPSEAVVDGTRHYMKSAAIVVSCLADEVCGAGENYLNCPEDCSSGAEDGICDEVSDGICDPDCASGFDNDCPEEDITIGNETAGSNMTGNIITDTVQNNISNVNKPAVPEGKEAIGFDLASVLPYAIVVVVLAAGIVYFMRKKG